jgi:hypothetical protein
MPQAYSTWLFDQAATSCFTSEQLQGLPFLPWVKTMGLLKSDVQLYQTIHSHLATLDVSLEWPCPSSSTYQTRWILEALIAVLSPGGLVP